MHMTVYSVLARDVQVNPCYFTKVGPDKLEPRKTQFASPLAFMSPANLLVSTSAHPIGAEECTQVNLLQ